MSEGLGITKSEGLGMTMSEGLGMTMSEGLGMILKKVRIVIPKEQRRLRNLDSFSPRIASLSYIRLLFKYNRFA